jgi:hypothetical protein
LGTFFYLQQFFDGISCGQLDVMFFSPFQIRLFFDRIWVNKFWRIYSQVQEKFKLAFWCTIKIRAFIDQIVKKRQWGIGLDCVVWFNPRECLDPISVFSLSFWRVVNVSAGFEGIRSDHLSDFNLLAWIEKVGIVSFEEKDVEWGWWNRRRTLRKVLSGWDKDQRGELYK